MPLMHSPPLHSGDAVSPIAKAKKTTRLPLSCSKKHPLSLNVKKGVIHHRVQTPVKCGGDKGILL
jgi:hypothetical protein